MSQRPVGILVLRTTVAGGLYFMRVLEKLQFEKPERQVLVRDAMVTMPKTLGPLTTVKQVRAEFEDDHIHMLLVVDAEQYLITTIERSDVPLAANGGTRASMFGTLVGRTIKPDSILSAATSVLKSKGQRRLAVTDDRNRLVGLLCLKRNGSGYCSDEGVQARIEERSSVSSRACYLRAPEEILVGAKAADHMKEDNQQ
jgi:CBS-domain-containing membrane protein